MDKDVFISYKAEEFDDANWVKSILEKNGISCWMAPDSIPGGSSYAAEITQAIKGCKVFVLILSEKAQVSKWIPKELDQAINENKTILPFMVENCSLKDDFNFYLTNVQRYAAYESKSNAIKKMIKEIKALLSVSEDFTHPKPAAVPVKKKTIEKSKSSKSHKRWFGIGLAVLLLGLIGISIIQAINTVTIAGEKYKKNETFLHLRDEELSEEDVTNIAKLNELISLSFENCILSSSDLSIIIKPDLRSLYFADCGLTEEQIKSIDLSETSLTSLDLSGNKLDSLDIIVPVAETLTELDISDTGITDLSLIKNCPNLWGFYGNNNGITDISPLSDCRSLTTIALDGNSITDLSSLAYCTELQKLYVNDNDLQNLSGLENCIELYELQAGSNRITTLDGLTNTTLLSFVFLNDNQITDISVLDKSANELRYLYLNNNKITDISPLQNCIYLERLSIDKNMIESLAPISSCTLLECLSAADNKLTTVKEVESLSLCQYWNLANNQLTAFGENQMVLFESENVVLDLGGNNISLLQIEPGTDIRLLNLQGNPLTDYQVLYDSSIRYFYFDYAENIDYTSLSEMPCDEFVIIDCPLDRQVELRTIMKEYRVEFTDSENSGYDKRDFMGEWVMGVPEYYN